MTRRNGSEKPGEHTLPAVGILLLNWRTAGDTMECLESVFRQDYPRFKVVVCDNGSEDASLDALKEWAAGRRPAPIQPGSIGERFAAPPVNKPISVVECDRATAESDEAPAEKHSKLILIQTGANLGFAGGNNIGLRYLLRQPEFQYVWLLNTDTVVEPGALEAMVRVSEANPQIGMVGAKILEYSRPTRIQAIAGGALKPWQGLTRHLGAGQLDEGQWSQDVEPDFITGASLLVRTETVRGIGLISEEYFLYSEEVDWCLRARRRGWRLAYSPGSEVWHKGGVSVGDGSPSHDYYTIRSALMLVKKFYPAYLPAAFMYLLCRGIAPKLFRLQPRRLRASLRAYRDFLTGSPSERHD